LRFKALGQFGLEIGQVLAGWALAGRVIITQLEAL
jgi:hypothetical protein